MLVKSAVKERIALPNVVVGRGSGLGSGLGLELGLGLGSGL